MPTTADDIRLAALEEFAAAGYSGTSLQHIADRAGVSKATVLYHFASKDVLLDAVLAPALDQLDQILEHVRLDSLSGDGEARARFLEQFVDFLLENRLAAYIFVNQSASLVDVPVMDRANAIIALIARYFEENIGSVLEKVRFGVALGGAAYLLAGAPIAGSGIQLDVIELRSALLAVLGELLGTQPAATVPAATHN